MSPLKSRSESRLNSELETEVELERHSRHILLKECGVEGIEKIRSAKVLVIGLGGLGSPVVTYLAAAGVGSQGDQSNKAILAEEDLQRVNGRLGLVDFDEVEPSNLHRQTLYQKIDIGRKKSEVAGERVLQINPQVNTVVYPIKMGEEEFKKIVQEYDLVVGAVDQENTKWMIHDVCLEYGVPLIHAGVVGLEGQLLTIIPGKTACLKCFFTKQENTTPLLCSEAGVLGPLCGTLGTLQAGEVLRFCYLEDSDKLSFTNRLLNINLARGQFKTFKLSPGMSCSHCIKPL